MKILMVTPYVPYPPSSGGQIRTFNLLKYLSNNHEIYLVCLYKNEEEKQFEKFLKPYCKEIYLCQRSSKPWTLKNVFKTVFSLQPFLIVRNYSHQAKNIINKLLQIKKLDVIHAETFYVMPHLPKTNIPIILVEQTIEYKVYQHFLNSLPFLIRVFLFFDILKLIYWERYYWKKANIVCPVSSYDEKIIKKIEPKIKTAIIPNGAGEEMIVKKLPKKNFENPILIFQGNFNWLQNTEAVKFLVEKIYPALKKNHPEIKLIISGQSANKIKKFIKNKEIEVINLSLNETNKVKNLYQKAHLFIAPIFGPGGTRLKILSAMASGLPVISTSTGVEGLNVKNNLHVLIANKKEDFVQKINQILKNQDQYYFLQKNAYKHVVNNFNWQNIAKKLEKVYQDIKL